MFSSGTIVDERYELIELVGSGGMGTVYKAREMGLDRIVALKMLNDTLLTDEESRVRFLREGTVASELEHPSLVRIYRFGIWNRSWPYLTMEFLQGRSLRETLSELGRVEQIRAVKIAIQICQGVQAMHNNGIVHRDLKPNNIMLVPQTDGTELVKIIDFGLARLAEEQGQKLTQTGQLVGSIFYMSPEQCKGQKSTFCSDIYALGCLLYETICGEPPLIADNPVALLSKHLSELPTAIEEKLSGNDVLPGLNLALCNAMAKNPDQRYATMSEFRTDLELVVRGVGDSVPVRATAQEKPRTRKPILRILSILALLLGPFALCSLLIKASQLSDTAEKKSAAQVFARRGDDLERLKRRFLTTFSGEKAGIAQRIIDENWTQSQKLFSEMRWEEAEDKLMQSFNYIPYCDSPSAEWSVTYRELARISYAFAWHGTQPSVRKQRLLKALQLCDNATAEGKKLSLREVGFTTRVRSLAEAAMGNIEKARCELRKLIEIYRDTPAGHDSDSPDLLGFARELQGIVTGQTYSCKDRLAICDMFLIVCSFLHDRNYVLSDQPIQLARSWLDTCGDKDCEQVKRKEREELLNRYAAEFKTSQTKSY